MNVNSSAGITCLGCNRAYAWCAMKCSAFFELFQRGGMITRPIVVIVSEVV